ncbi:archaellin/type IV pilin N-terminal domain-containing protein [Halorhabdus rudnickae]|uniref:archaellin/type IV pilin N-terminal domain-containing protein n=1 Tax=Halorhabdus rudnickae TaxID=1775544 RepID=UPI001FCE751B|nr:archaellin/type IV pilin N-terminal domain-containing protein [Halorhabdus rudnickae]
MRDGERAQVGIGTLIVFIAMVLVAAVAASVLINTAGFLQSSAERSGVQAADQVTNRLVEEDSVGIVDAASGTVTTVEMTVTPAPGSQDVDLNDTTIQWVSYDGSQQLVYIQPGSASVGEFNWTTLRDNDGSIANDDILNHPIDKAVLTIELGSGDQPSELEPGTKAKAIIVTGSGGKTTEALVVPDSLSQKETVRI